MFKFYELISRISVPSFVTYDGNKIKLKREIDVALYLKLYGFRR